MDLKYKKEMEKHGLSYAELPEDAQTGIDAINDVLRGFNMLEKKGQRPSAKAVKKLNAMDKWVYYEILDVVNDTIFPEVIVLFAIVLFAVTVK